MQAADLSSPKAMPKNDWRFALRALHYRNYKLFFSGQILSLIGTWITTVATSWLVYKLASQDKTLNAPFIMGVVAFSSQIPQLFLGPFAGVWVDRLNKHKILVFTQVLSMLQSFALAILAFSGYINIPWMIALNVFQGLVNSIDMPARQSFVVTMIEDRKDLSNAIALNSSMVHVARLMGPAVAGFLIYHFGESYCFLIDGVSYLAVIIALLNMKVPKHERQKNPPRTWHGFKEGLKYAIDFTPIRSLLILMAITSILTMSQSVLMPIFADQIIGGGERMYGFLLGAAGLGALVGSVYLASRRSIVGLGRVIIYGDIVMGITYILFAFSRWAAWSMPLLFLNGLSFVLIMASANTILQSVVDDSKRGRVMSLFAIAFLGMAPIGSLLGGSLAARVGAPWTTAISGIGCLVSSFYFIRQLPNIRKVLRPIYEQMGILEVKQ